MTFRFSDTDDALRKEVREFLRSRLPHDWTGISRQRPHEPSGKLPTEVSKEITLELAANGWLNRHWPRAYGGQEAPISEQIVLQEEYEANFEPRGSQYMGVNWIGPALMEFGTQEQKDRYIPDIAAGRSCWAQLFSEPEAGSDLAALRTTARLEGDEFVVNGTKLWTSYADIARHGVLIARTTPGAVGHEGMSVLLIEMDTPGIEVREIPATLGHNRISQEMFIDARVPRSSLLGELNDGWRVAMKALSYERSGIAGHARATRVLGRMGPLTPPEREERDIELLVQGRLAELVYYEAALNRDRQDAWLSSAVRLQNAEYLQKVTAHVEEVLGVAARIGAEEPRGTLSGEIESFAVKRARVAKITAGTAEVHIGVIGRRALGLPRS